MLFYAKRPDLVEGSHSLTRNDVKAFSKSIKQNGYDCSLLFCCWMVNIMAFASSPIGTKPKLKLTIFNKKPEKNIKYYKGMNKMNDNP